VLMKNSSFLKLFTVVFLLSVSASGYSNPEDLIHSFEDGSRFNQSKSLYYPPETEAPQKVKLYVEIEEGVMGRPRCLLDSEIGDAGTVCRVFWGENNEKERFKYVENRIGFEEACQTLRGCNAESDPFFSQGEAKIEHILRTFESGVVYTVERWLPEGPRVVTFRLFTPGDSYETFSKPAKELCPASKELGKLTTVRYTSDSTHDQLRQKGKSVENVVGRFFGRRK
jgi:hypothetical protein